MKLKILMVVVMVSFFPALLQAGEEASVYFISPQDGAVVSGDFTIRFGLRGMGVAPPALSRLKPVTTTC